jgi:hypothetical protein
MMASMSSIIGGLNIGSDRELRPMKTGEAGGWGMKYKWIELSITEDNQGQDNRTAPFNWCVEYFGKEGVRWFEKKGKFYFKNEPDLTMFILKWS